MGSLKFTNLPLDALRLEVESAGRRWTVEFRSGAGSLSVVTNPATGSLELSAVGVVRRAETGPVDAPLLPIEVPPARQVVVEHVVVEHAIVEEYVDGSDRCLCGSVGDWDEHLTELGVTDGR